MALALVLLVSAGLMIRSFQALRRVDPGFTEPEHVQTFSISIPATVVAEPERVTRMQHEILDKIAAIPGVASAAFTTRLPMGSDRSSSALARRRHGGRWPDAAQPAGQDHLAGHVPARWESPLVAGRDFTWTDLYDMRDVAIVSENLARELWGSPAAALGKRIREYYAQEGAVARDRRRGRRRPRRRRRSTAAGDDLLAGAARRATAEHVRIPVAPGQLSPSAPNAPAREDLLDQVREAVWSVNATSAAGAGAHAGRGVRPVDGADVLHAGDAGDRRRDGAAAGHLRPLRRDRVRRVAAAARNRHPAGARRAGARDPPAVRAARAGSGGHRRGDRPGRRRGCHTVDAIAAVRHSPLDPITFTAMPVVLAAAAVLASYLPARRAVAVDPVETLRAE